MLLKFLKPIFPIILILVFTIEILLQVLFFYNVSFVKQPALFYNGFCDQKYWNIINRKSKYDEKIKYELSEIVFQVDTKKKLNEMIDEIKESIASKGFKNTATIYSISDSSKFGGQIGWVNEEQLSKLILNEVKKLNTGEITDPINIPGGLLILKLENVKSEKIEINLDEALNNLIEFEKSRQLNQFSTIYFNKIKINSKISEQ